MWAGTVRPGSRLRPDRAGTRTARRRRSLSSPGDGRETSRAPGPGRANRARRHRCDRRRGRRRGRASCRRSCRSRLGRPAACPPHRPAPATMVCRVKSFGIPSSNLSSQPSQPPPTIRAGLPAAADAWKPERKAGSRGTRRRMAVSSRAHDTAGRTGGHAEPSAQGMPERHRAAAEPDRPAERPRSVRRGQAVHLRQNPLLQVLVLHVLGQGVEAVRVLDRVAADDLADAVLRLSGPVLAGRAGSVPRRGRRDFAPPSPSPARAPRTHCQ